MRINIINNWSGVRLTVKICPKRELRGNLTPYIRHLSQSLSAGDVYLCRIMKSRETPKGLGPPS